MDNLLKDLGYSFRALWKNPGFAATAILALALGIGANSVIFGVAKTILLKPLPYKEAERLVLVSSSFIPLAPDAGGSGPEIVHFRERSQSLESVAAVKFQTFNLTGDANPEQIIAGVVSANFFDVLGVAPSHGRTYAGDENAADDSRSVVLHHRFWQRRFGSRPDIANASILLDGQSYRVIGVMPPDFGLLPSDSLSPSSLDLWVRQPVDFARTSRSEHHYRVIARLKPGISLEAAQADMKIVGQQMEKEFYSQFKGYGYTIEVRSWHASLTRRIRPALLVLLGAVGFVLLIACLNVANLLLARSVTRGREISIRSALGASRSRLVRQLLTESVVLALVGGLMGLIFTYLGIKILVGVAPSSVPRLNELSVDGQIFGFTLAVSLLTGVVFGLVPALQSTRLDLSSVLNEAGRAASSSARGRRIRGALVVAEIALSLVLLTGAGLLTRSFLRLQQVNPGFVPEGLLTVQLQLPPTRYSGGTQVSAFYDQLIERVRALPGVEAAGTTSGLPMGGTFSTSTIAIDKRPIGRGIDAFEPDVRSVSPDYFSAMKIALVHGRFFTDLDGREDAKVAIVNDVFAKRFFSDENPIGQRINLMRDLHGGRPWATIVGVVGHVRDYGLDAPEKEQVYFPQRQDPIRNSFVVARTGADPSLLVSAVRTAVLSLDPDQPISNVRTMEERVYASVAQPRFNMVLLGAFSSIALTLAAIGIYGVMSYSVTQRTREIGIRMALGARPYDVSKLVLGHSLWLVLIGVGGGVGGAIAVTRLMASLLFGTSVTDPLTFVAVSAVLIGVALVASYIPARRAMRVDPLTALRHD